ncbi:MAG: hypothetical protein AMXMBFR53_36920 [Gemmatimonadota bacterium]
MIRHALGTALLATLLVSAAASAQSLGDLQTGQRVRVTSGLRSRTVGFVQSQEAGSLALLDDDGMLRRFPLTEVARIELHKGTGRRFGRDLLVTMAVSAGAFGILSAATYEPCDGWFCIGPNSPGEAFMWGAVGGGILGIPVGVVVGLVSSHDRWIEVDRSSRDGASVSVIPSADGRVRVVGSLPVRW